jgi:ATP-dependent DNA ligase
MNSSPVFIKPMHPKTEIGPVPRAIAAVLKAGWAGQAKVLGHRAQIHLSADPRESVVAYNRHGRPHKKILPPKMAEELKRIFPLTRGWTVVDGEWLKTKNRLFIFDVMKLNDKSLRSLSYAERYQFLPRLYISPHVRTLPLLMSVPKCMEVLASSDEDIEGLVFKSLRARGFEDSSIIRCRRRA